MTPATDANQATDPYEAAARVVDPELRVVTIADLGILRHVTTDGDRAEVTLTPTYSGCPAMDVIRRDVADAVRAAGWPDVAIHTSLSPPWSTDWITDTGRARLAAAGIAPPGRAVGAANNATVLLGLPTVRAPAPSCPVCGDADTGELSRFGATACMALWRCRSCGEPFEHLKAV